MAKNLKITEEAVPEKAPDEVTPVTETTQAMTSVPMPGTLQRDPDDPFGDSSAPERESYRVLKGRMDAKIKADGIHRSISFTDLKGPNGSRRRTYFMVAGEYKR